MHGKFAWFLTLAVFSGLSMNLILRFGIGLQRIAVEEGAPLGNSGKDVKWAFLVWPGIYFISVMLLWLFFSGLQSVIFLGFLEYILIFPVSSLFFTVMEYLAARLALKTNRKGETVSRNRFISDYLLSAAPADAPTLHGAQVGAALFIMLGLAGGFAEAVMLSFGFSAGAALAVLIVGEIRRRSAMEAVPRCLKGGPLVLVTMGLLSLVIISAATVFYAVLGVE